MAEDIQADINKQTQKKKSWTPEERRESGAEIAKDIRARVADLNAVMKEAAALGLRVLLDAQDEECGLYVIGEQPHAHIKVEILQPL